MNNPLVSILIANYNNGKYLKEALDSAYNQTYDNIEIVVIDDNSDDNSVEIVSEYIKDHPNRIIRFYQNNDNAGCGRIKRQCIEKSSGDYFAFLDPDDTIVLDAIEKLVGIHMKGNYGIVYSTHLICDENLNILHKSFLAGPIKKNESNLTSSRFHVTALALCSLHYYAQTKGINSTYVVAEDQDMYYKIEEKAALYYYDEPLYFYRKHTHNMSLDDTCELRNAYWNYICRKSAYLRRLFVSGVPNLSLRQVLCLFFEYVAELIKYNKCKDKFYFHLLPIFLCLGIISPKKFVRKSRLIWRRDDD